MERSGIATKASRPAASGGAGVRGVKLLVCASTTQLLARGWLPGAKLPQKPQAPTHNRIIHSADADAVMRSNAGVRCRMNAAHTASIDRP